MITLRSGVGLTTSGGAAEVRVQPPADNLLVATHGDSMTRDQGRFNYLFVLQASILSGQSLRAATAQRGINGISYNYRWTGEPYTETMATDAPLVVDPARRTDIPSWLVVFAGTNGMAIGLHSAATEYADFKTYIAARIVAGWSANRIVVATMLPRGGFTDATRQTFNASLVGDDGGYGYRLARLDQNASIGDAGDSADATYFYDTVHPTIAGHSVIAGIIYSAMFP